MPKNGQSHLDVTIVPDAAPIPGDRAKLLAMIDHEFGDDDDAPGYAALVAELEGIDPLTGDPLATDAKDAEATDAKDAEATDAKDAEATDTKDAEATDAKDAEATDAKDAEASGIATADGRHVLPYGVLKAERDSNARLEAEIASLRAQLGATAARRPDRSDDANRDRSADSQRRQATDNELQASLAKIREDFGEDVAKPLEIALKRTSDVTTDLRSEIADLKEQLASRDRVDADDRRSQTQRDIETIPVLATWQADYVAAQRGDPSRSDLMFKQAMALDDVLRDSVEWAGRPQVERFAEVVRTLGGGDALTSGSPMTSQDRRDASTETAAGKGAERSNVNVDDALRVAQKRAGPNSLSDLPAGDAPRDSISRFDQLNQYELTEAFLSMSPEDVSSHLSRFS